MYRFAIMDAGRVFIFASQLLDPRRFMKFVLQTVGIASNCVVVFETLNCMQITKV